MGTNALDQRRRFVAALMSGHWSMSELCARFGYRARRLQMGGACGGGRRGLGRSQSRAPPCPHRLARAWPSSCWRRAANMAWGARNCWQSSGAKRPETRGPARSTVNDLLARHHLLRRQRRAPVEPSGQAPLATTGPNQCGPPISKGSSRGRRALLLSVDRDRSLQSRRARLSRPGLRPRPQRPPGVSRGVPRGRSARCDPHETARPSRRRPAWLVGVELWWNAVRHRPSTDCTGLPATQRRMSACIAN